MCGNGAGIGMIKPTTVKVLETTQPVLRLGLYASTAAVVGTAFLPTVQFLTVASGVYLTATTTAMVSVLCVPILIKN